MSGNLAINGGTPVRSEKLSIFKLNLEEDDLEAVRQNLIQGPISRGAPTLFLENSLKMRTGAASACMVASGSAALHLALLVLNLPKGSEIIVPAMTFAATALAPLYVNCVPIFADIDPLTWTLDCNSVSSKITHNTRAIITVDYAGQVSDISGLKRLAHEIDAWLIEDAAHSIGAKHETGCVGAVSDLTAFSFFATKNITAGEGGAVTTIHDALNKRLHQLRAHGIVRNESNPIAGYYDVEELGYNFHLSNINIALLQNQLTKLDRFNIERRRIATLMKNAIGTMDRHNVIKFPSIVRDHVHHLFSIQLDLDQLSFSRDEVVMALIAEGIDCGIYYRPVHLFTFFRKHLGTKEGMLANTERVSESLVTLPLYPGMDDKDVLDVATALTKITNAGIR